MCAIRIIIQILLYTKYLTPPNNHNEKRQNEVVWESIKGKEYSNFDDWAGTGVLFYEKDQTKYCIFMIYGSGVPVAQYDICELVFKDNTIEIVFPKSSQMKPLDKKQNDNIRIRMTIKEAEISIEGKRFVLAGEQGSFNYLKNNNTFFED